MKYTHGALFASLLLAASHTAVMAATDTKSIDIEVTKDTFVELIGSAVDGNTKNITIDSIKAGNPTNLGTVGISSNIAAGANNAADCTISFSALNNYSLNHETSGVSLSKFFLTFKNKTISDNADANKDITVNCNLVPTVLTFTPSGAVLADGDIVAGIYKDTVTLTVTSP